MRMSSSNTARTNDAATLAELDSSGRRAALLRLGGEFGGVEAAHAARRVNTIRRATQARQLALPDLAETARARRSAAIRGNCASLPDGDFPRHLSAGENWQMLVGVHVTLQRHNDAHSQYLTAVVLGVDPDSTEPRLRLGLSCEALGRQVGQAVTISVCHWQCNPSPAEELATASRKNRRMGRPLYSDIDVPVEVLATTGELARRRKRPATLQPPIASVRRSRGATDLYAILDAEDLPAPANAEPALAHRRTCTACGRTSPAPWPSTRAGERYCPDHIEAARLRVEAALVARNRAVSAVWAREVLADPQTVLVAMLGEPDDLRVRVEELAGTILLDDAIAKAPLGASLRRHFMRTMPVRLPAWVFSDRAHQVAGRRSIVASSQGADSAYSGLVESTPTNRFLLTTRRGDAIGRRHDIWLGDSSLRWLYDGLAGHDRPLRLSAEDEQSLDLADVITQTRQRLTMMAATLLTERQLEHATSLHHDRAAPEYAVWCRNQERRTRVRTAQAVALFSPTGRQNPTG